MKRLPLLLAGALLATPATALDYWVDPEGRGGPCSDGHSGIVLEEALCTLEGCIGKVLQPGDRCILREGTYTAMPDPGRDGAPHAPIVFARYGRDNVVIADGTLDLRERADVRYEGLHFWNVRMLLQGARRIALAECTLEEGVGAPLVEPDSEESPTEPSPALPGDPSVALRPTLARDASEPPRPPVLGIEAGGTGAETVEGARQNLGVPSLEDVVRSYGDDWVAGTKVFTEQLFARRAHGVRHSAQFSSIADCLADLSADQGTCQIDPFEDDATPFALTNLAGVDAQGAPIGVKNTVVVDGRGGRVKWLSSAPPPWGSNLTAASENDVPFVFQTRYHDSTHLAADADWNGQRDGDSWSCNIDLKICSGSARLCATDADCGSGSCQTPTEQEWRACPYGHFTGGQDVRDGSWWYTGQCNANSALAEQRQLCGGQSIFEVRYPQIDDGDGVWEPGEHVNKPAFKVGTHGVGIYFPESQGPDATGILTVFRSNDSPFWSPAVKNKPFFSVHNHGVYMDGGFFVGGTNAWPFPFNGVQWEHDAFNAWIAHDITPGLPALVVEGPNNEDAASEVTPIFSVYSRAGYYGSHTRDPGVHQEVALEVTANGDVILGATCPADADGCVGTMEDSQRIIWKGTDPRDAAETVLHVVDPTARRDIYLPDASGVLALAGQSTGARIDCGAVQVDVPMLAAESTLEITITASQVIRPSACVCSVGAGLHDDAFLKNCAPRADGELVLSIYNASRQILQDDDTPAMDVDYCCIAP